VAAKCETPFRSDNSLANQTERAVEAIIEAAFQRHAAPVERPFFVLLPQHCSDEPRDGPVVGKMPEQVAVSPSVPWFENDRHEQA